MGSINHILIFEPRIEGHHLAWLPLITEAMLDSGYQLTLAIDERTGEARRRIASRSTRALKETRVISAYDCNDKIRKGSKINAALECLQESGADEVFFNSLDEFTSSMFRKAVFGLRPSKKLKGKISGIYIRPRPLDPNAKGLNNFVKKCGFKKITQERWFRCVYLLDEFLTKNNECSKSPQYYFIPDPWEGDFSMGRSDARNTLGIPEEKFVLLHYGTSSRRKGLHLLIKALEMCSFKDKLFLIVAGNQDKNPGELKILKGMEKQGRALIMNRYICSPEEKQIFKATDLVMMPYIGHYGSSTVLSVAAAAKRPVLASDYHLVGRRVINHQLGVTFKNDDTQSLTETLDTIVSNGRERLKRFEPNLEKFAQMTSRKAFESALHHAYPPIRNKV
jgi:glycosyltransferase involved in cell wall biosynthesis